MKTKVIIIVLIVTFTSYGQNAFQDDFSTYTPGVKLDGQGPWTNNTSNGGLGSCGPLNTCFSLVSQAPISYPDWGSSITSVELKNDSDSNGTIFTPITSNVVYFGLVINVTNASGTPQDCFRVATGNFATAREISVEYINDRWEGTPQTDRNLYVDSVGLNGQTFKGSDAVLDPGIGQNSAVAEL